MKRMNERNSGVVLTSVGIGCVIAITIGMIAVMVLSLLLIKRGISERMTPTVITVVLFVASFIGAFVAGKRAGQKYAIVCTGVSVMYCVCLLAGTVIFFGSRFNGVGKGIIACIIGGVVACTLCVIRKRKKTRMK